MIRTLWVGIAVVAATLGYGTIAIIASFLRVRGDIYSRVTRDWARTILRASGTPVEVRGLDNLRLDAPQIIVSNHVSGYDIFAIASVMPGPFHFVAKKELERVPFFGIAWRAAGHISIDRSDRQRAILSLRRAGEKIRRENAAVVIFPEGTRSRTGELQPFKKGAFLLAVEAQVPVVPTVVKGSYDIMQPDRWRIRPHPIQVHFGTPVPVQGIRPGEGDLLMEQVHSCMQDMLSSGHQAPHHVTS